MIDIKEKLKNSLYFVIGVAGMFFLLLLGAVILNGVVWVGEHTLQWLINFSWIVFALNLFVLLPLALFRKTGIIGGIGLYISSQVFGLTLWFLALLLTYFTWGFFGVIVGIILGVVGIVPVAMLAMLLNGELLYLVILIILTILTFGTKFLGLYLAGRAEEKNNYENERETNA